MADEQEQTVTELAAEAWALIRQLYRVAADDDSAWPVESRMST